MTRALHILLVAFVLITTVSSSARADDDPVAAEALFDEGRRLMKAERYDEACAKFEASQRLDPGVGTLLNLGDCLEHAGKLASAWARFREAASLAVSSGQHERELAARERARTLEDHLPRLVVRPAAPIDSLEIARDGIVIERALWGTAVPVDPGKHVVRASAPGKIAWSAELVFDGTSAGQTKTLGVPALADAAIASSWGPQRTVSVIAFGLGLAAAAVGTGLALDAKSSYDDARNRCTASGCSADARSKAASAESMADVATGLFIGSAVMVAAGVVLFVTAPRHAPTLRVVGGLPAIAF